MNKPIKFTSIKTPLSSPKNEKWGFAIGDYKLEVFAETVNHITIKLFG